MSKTDQSGSAATSVVAFGRSMGGVANLSDTAFLQSIQWRKSADADLVRAARKGDVSAFTARLLQCLPAESPPTKSTKKRPAIQGGLATAEYLPAPPAKPLRELLHTSNGHFTRKTGKSTAVEAASLAEVLNSVAQKNYKTSPADLHALTELIACNGASLEQATLFLLWRTTLAAACEFTNDPSTTDEGDPAQTADEQLLQAGELPWRVGLLFGDVKGSTKIRRRGRKVIRRELEDRTDGDGTPHATLLPRLGYWLAALVRSGQWANRFQATLWDDDLSMLFNDLLEQAIRLYRPSDSWAMSNGFSASPRSLFRAASQLAGSEFKIADLAFAWDQAPSNTRKRKAKSKKSASASTKPRLKKLAPSSQSDWANLACLRSDWETECDSIVVDHNGQFPQIDMTVLGRALINGNWDLKIQVDGKPVSVKRQWTAICWNTDEDGDYIELQQTFASGGRVERQIWLSRSTHSAMFADSLTGFSGKQIEYSSRLPLSDALDTQSDSGDRETRLKDGPILTRVFPLFLPQDRVHGTPGGCGIFGDDLVLKHVAAGQGLYAPIVLDWHPDRRRKPVQWRKLTVTEDGRILPGDVSAGYRVRLGEQHLLAYRKLQKSDLPQTVLGFQTFDETVLGQFDKNGDVTPLLLVE
ncbi:hypothetical protein [Symmachiella dynata]|nr:hypothetical protein [Symmachiella dynata]